MRHALKFRYGTNVAQTNTFKTLKTSLFAILDKKNPAPLKWHRICNQFYLKYESRFNQGYKVFFRQNRYA